MAPVSNSPPGSAGDSVSSKSVSQSIPASVDDRWDTKLEAAREASTASAFVNSAPIREGKVQNAVKFLAHPSVRGAPAIYRRSFLESKGLTKEEIDEAFRHVPDPSTLVTTTGHLVNSQDGEARSSPSIQSQPPEQVLQLTSSKMGMLSQFKWCHGIIALGFLVTSGIGAGVLFKNSVIPWFKSWIRKVILDEKEHLVKKSSVTPHLAEETAVSVKAAAIAAADVARTSQEMLISWNEEKRCFDELIHMLNVQVTKIKSMSNSLKMLENGQSVNGRSTGSTPIHLNGGLTADSHSESPSPRANVVDSSSARYPNSYMEILDMIRRGERPPNIRDIDDRPPNPDQPLTNPRLAPRPKPWEANQRFTNTHTIQGRGTPMNADGTLPLWQQRRVQFTEIDSDVELPVGRNPSWR